MSGAEPKPFLRGQRGIHPRCNTRHARAERVREHRQVYTQGSGERRPGEREKRLARIPFDCEKLSLVFSPAPGRRVGCSLRELVKVDGSRLIAPVADTIIRDTDRETDMYTPGFGQGNLQEDENM